MNPAKLQGVAAKAMDELVAAVDAGHSERLREYLVQIAKFHGYSIGNLFLIKAQCPQASRVAGYRTWQSMGRQVRRGAKAIRIFAPVVRKRSAQDNEEEEDFLAGFRTVCIFDISQTEGRPLATPASVQGDPGGHLARLKDELPPDVYTAALADGRALELDTAVLELLVESMPPPGHKVPLPNQ